MDLRIIWTSITLEWLRKKIKISKMKKFKEFNYVSSMNMSLFVGHLSLSREYSGCFCLCHAVCFSSHSICAKISITEHVMEILNTCWILDHQITGQNLYVSLSIFALKLSKHHFNYIIWLTWFFGRYYSSSYIFIISWHCSSFLLFHAVDTWYNLISCDV